LALAKHLKARRLKTAFAFPSGSVSSAGFPSPPGE
jgi:hypothetical protein